MNMLHMLVSASLLAVCALPAQALMMSTSDIVANSVPSISLLPFVT